MNPSILPVLSRSILAIAVACAPSLATRVAVLDFESGTESGSLQFLAQTLPNALVEPLLAQPGIEVVERSQVARILQERQLSLTGASLSDSTISLLSADFLVMGQFGGGMDALRMQVRLVQSATGTVRGAFSRSGTLKDILAAMPTIAAQVAQAARGENTGSLSIHTRPAGATVLLDGRVLGRTPLVDQKIAIGAHALNIELPGYRAWSDSVTIVGGAHALNIELPGQRVWSDSVTIVAAAPVERTVELEADDDRSGLWIQGGGSMCGFSRGFEDPNGAFLSGDLALLARSRRLGVQLGFEFPAERAYDVTYPVPWSTRTDTRTLSGLSWSLQVVGDVLQAGPAAFHLGAGVTYSNLDVSPHDLSEIDGDSKSVGLLGGVVSAGARWRLHPAVEILAETQAGTSFNEVETIDIVERDLFVANTTTREFTLQSWSARVAARFRIQ